jgi:hypothetical protein
MLEWLTNNWKGLGWKLSFAYRDWKKPRKAPVTIVTTVGLPGRYLKRKPLCCRGLLWINYPLQNAKVQYHVLNCPQIDFLSQVNQRLVHFHKIHLNIIPFMFRSPKCSLPFFFYWSIFQSPLHATSHSCFSLTSSLVYHCGYKLCTSSSSTLLYHPVTFS